MKGSVFGTYIHGLFDEGGFTNQFIKILAERKGFKWEEGETAAGEPSKSQIFNRNSENAGLSASISKFKESQYNLLAQTLREHLVMKKIYEIMGLNQKKRV